MDLTPDMLDVERLVGEALEPGPLGTYGDQFHTAAPFSRVPWMEAILGAPIRATIQGGQYACASRDREMAGLGFWCGAY